MNTKYEVPNGWSIVCDSGIDRVDLETEPEVLKDAYVQYKTPYVSFDCTDQQIGFWYQKGNSHQYLKIDASGVQNIVINGNEYFATQGFEFNCDGATVKIELKDKIIRVLPN